MLLLRAQDAFEEADDALRSGDTVTYARKIQDARRILERAFALAEQRDQPPASEE